MFHHAKSDYVMMTRWLPENEENKLPHYATHYVGVGGFVLNDVSIPLTTFVDAMFII